MKESGCQGVGIGIESIDNNILKEYKKGTTIEMVERAIKIIKFHKISCGGFFLIGAPSDTKEIILKQLDFAKKMDLDIALWANLIPYPQTETYEWANKNNYWTIDNPFEVFQSTTTKNGLLYSTPLLSAEEKKESFGANAERMGDYDYSRSKNKTITKVKNTVLRNRTTFYYATKIKAIIDRIGNIKFNKQKTKCDIENCHWCEIKYKCKGEINK